MSARVIRNCSNFVASTITTPPILTNLVSWWDLATDITTDNTHQGNTLSKTGTVINVGNYAAFDGSSYLSNTTIPSLYNVDTSVCMWVSNLHIEPYLARGLCGQVVNGDTMSNFNLQYNGLDGSIHTNLNSGELISGNVSDGLPHFLLITVSTTGVLTLQIDNGIISSRSGQTRAPGAVTTRIGTVSTAGCPIYGYINRVGIWNKLLSTAEATFLYNSGNGYYYDNMYPAVQNNSPYTKYWSYGAPAYEITRTPNRTATQKYWSYGGTSGWLFPKGMPKNQGTIIC